MAQLKNNIKKYKIVYIIMLLFTILCTSLYIDKVNAALVISSDSGGTGSNSDCVTLTTSRSPNVPSKLYLGGVLAFCIEKEVYTTPGTKYRLVGTTNVKNYRAAFSFYSKYGNNNTLDRYYYALAQTKVWGMTYTNAYLLVKNYLSGLGYNVTETMKGFNYDWTNFSKFSNGTVYLWEAVNNPGSKQKLITLSMPKTTTCEITESPRVCYTKDGKYYGLDGEEITKQEYDEMCSNGYEEPGDNDDDNNTNRECPIPVGSGASDCDVQGRYTDPTFDELKQCDVNKDLYLDDSQISTTYCKAYCIEEVNTNFPGSDYTFKAGQYFTIGSSSTGNTWGPISFTGVRTCKSFIDNGYTEGVNTEQFIKDYNATVLNEITAYNNAKNEERKNAAATTATAHQQDIRCSSTTSKVCDAGSIEGNQCVEYDYTAGYCSNYSAPDGCAWVDEKWTRRVVGTAHCPDGYYEDGGTCRQNKEYWGTWYDSKSYVTYNNSGSASTKYTKAGCSIDYGNPNWAAYENAKAKRLSLENTLQKCNSFNFDYNLQPEITLNYTADSNYQFIDKQLTANGYSTSNTVNGSAQANINGNGSNEAPAYCKGSDCQLVHYECSGDKCTYSSSKVNGATVAGVNVKEKTSITHNYQEYSLGSTDYRYSSKVDGSVKGSISSSNAGLYIDLGDNVIPISYTLVPNQYDISISYGKIGNIVNGMGHFDNYEGSSGTYSCPINIENDILCKDCSNGDTPSGLDVIYRPIELGEEDIAFPGINGVGRSPGANWVGTLDNGQTLVDAYITHNRGVADYEVYDMEPLYTITMTPSLIKQIRDYNKQVGDYSDFNLECNNGRQCYSEFIHESEFASEIGGLCGDSQRGQFDSCRTYGGAG